MLDCVVEKAREEEVFSREDTPTERRVLAAFLYRAGVSYRKTEPSVGRSYEAVRGWFHRFKPLLEPDCQQREEGAVDETNIDVDGQEVYVWAAVDCETLEVLAVEVSPGRSSLDALLFLEDVLAYCRGRPLVWAAAARGTTGPGTVGL